MPSEEKTAMQGRTDGLKPVCRLVGTDGNVFSIIGKVSKALKQAGETEQASEFSRKAFSAGSYDEVLRICMDYVEVE